MGEGGPSLTETGPQCVSITRNSWVSVFLRRRPGVAGGSALAVRVSAGPTPHPSRPPLEGMLHCPWKSTHRPAQTGPLAGPALPREPQTATELTCLKLVPGGGCTHARTPFGPRWRPQMPQVPRSMLEPSRLLPLLGGPRQGLPRWHHLPLWQPAPFASSDTLGVSPLLSFYVGTNAARRSVSLVQCPGNTRPGR